MATHIYLDESGDLGWALEAPYTQGGSSRYLIIAACVVPPALDHKPERQIRHLYKQRKWGTKSEKKWSLMSPQARTAFAKEAAQLILANPQIELHAIAVDKRHMPEHVRTDANKLYNYMVKCLLLDVMAKHDTVHFVPDPRSVKTQSGNSLHDYLQTELWFTKQAATKLITAPQDSRHCLNLQFTDMLAGVVQSHFEFGLLQHWQYLQAHVRLQSL